MKIFVTQIFEQNKMSKFTIVTVTKKRAKNYDY